MGADVLVTTPTRHPRASAAAVATGTNFNPFVNPDGSIGGIGQGPTSVQIGELKPASAPMLDEGEKQVEKYRPE